MRDPSGDHAAVDGGGFVLSLIACGFVPLALKTWRRVFGVPERDRIRDPSTFGRASRPGSIATRFLPEPSGLMTNASAESPARVETNTRPPTQLRRSSHSGVCVDRFCGDPSAWMTYVSLCLPSRTAVNAT